MLWDAFAGEARLAAQHKAMLKANDSLEGQLRYANYELAQLALIKTAHEDELGGLRERVASMSAEAEANRAAVAKAGAVAAELSDARELYRDAVIECEEARERTARVEADAAEQMSGNGALLKRLLDEQRVVFDAEMAKVREQLAEKTEAQKREARIEVLRKVAMRRMLYAGLTRGWDAWLDLRSSRQEARAALYRIGSRVQVRGVGAAFVRWTEAWKAKQFYLLHASSTQQLAHAERLEQEIERLHSEYEASASERARLEQRLIAESGGAEDVKKLLAEQAAAEKERRVELFGRQALR